MNINQDGADTKTKDGLPSIYFASLHCYMQMSVGKTLGQERQKQRQRHQNNINNIKSLGSRNLGNP
jgi:hypothetical protein